MKPSNIAKENISLQKGHRITIIGLGYVGLPHSRLFATKYSVVGFDINEKCLAELMSGHDSTLEVEDDVLQSVLIRDLHEIRPNPRNPETNPRNPETNPRNPEHYTTDLYCSRNLDDIAHCNIYVVTVPTPTNRNNRTDLTPLVKASETVSKVISKGDIVIYESTVYPGATEEDCIPVVENTSGLKYNVDFFAGYSPERINPGDKEHTVEKIKKVTSGSTTQVGQQADVLYRSVITAGTKWNFLPCKPGLVGGHCIGVDPYYLAQKAQEAGYHPEIILAGRRMNDSMGQYVASEVVKLMIKNGTPVKGARALMLGITFKENCPDIRNTKAIDIYHELKDYGMEVDVYDPWANPGKVMHEYSIKTITEYPEKNGYSAIILAVAHNEFLSLDLKAHKNNGAVIYDVKGILEKELADGRL